MDIENFIGLYVQVDLNSGTVHQGILEKVRDDTIVDYLRISNGHEIYFFSHEDVMEISVVLLN